MLYKSWELSWNKRWLCCEVSSDIQHPQCLRASISRPADSPCSSMQAVWPCIRTGMPSQGSFCPLGEIAPSSMWNGLLLSRHISLFHYHLPVSLGHCPPFGYTPQIFFLPLICFSLFALQNLSIRNDRNSETKPKGSSSRKRASASISKRILGSPCGESWSEVHDYVGNQHGTRLYQWILLVLVKGGKGLMVQKSGKLTSWGW